jgi:hypothetical protein
VFLFYLVIFKHDFLPEKLKNYTPITQALIMASNSIFYIFFNFKIVSELYNFNSCKIYLLHLIVVPQLSGGWQHNYSTKTRQPGQANDQSMYSLMSMVHTYNIPN